MLITPNVIEKLMKWLIIIIIIVILRINKTSINNRKQPHLVWLWWTLKKILGLVGVQLKLEIIFLKKYKYLFLDWQWIWSKFTYTILRLFYRLYYKASESSFYVKVSRSLFLGRLWASLSVGWTYGFFFLLCTFSMSRKNLFKLFYRVPWEKYRENYQFSL